MPFWRSMLGPNIGWSHYTFLFLKANHRNSAPMRMAATENTMIGKLIFPGACQFSSSTYVHFNYFNPIRLNPSNLPIPEAGGKKLYGPSQYSIRLQRSPAQSTILPQPMPLVPFMVSSFLPVALVLLPVFFALVLVPPIKVLQRL